ncbi:aldo-keto reductase yakc [Coleophoma crateriformis]|uniref:Aldo-keto reductase yakc n=1 Tax=Coleophoma crateriformis TaxID=565419 RepID=A0A3D8RJF3_9HELO|nr:aldo-keto reductase yakc [Coleophoma crateriformis]
MHGVRSATPQTSPDVSLSTFDLLRYAPNPSPLEPQTNSINPIAIQIEKLTMPFPQRTIGDDKVSALGLGCMGMSFGYTSYGGYDDAASLEVLTWAADHGITFWDTSDVYGPHTNELLLGKWFAETGRRKEIFLATKFANTMKDGQMLVRGDAPFVKEACAASLARLGVECIDLYYQHRVDTNTPIEETVQAMAELKKEGKIRYLGLSECSERTLRRAHAVHPIAAVQLEYSPFALEIESDQTNLLKAARELGVKIVAYSPLGRGFLTNTIKSRDDFDPKDTRVSHPRFSEEHFGENLKLVETLSGLAKKKGVTPSQLVLAWVLAQGEDFIPIPGTKRVKYLEENAKAVDVKLSKEEELEIRKEIEKVGGGKGERYPPAMLSKCFGDSPEL